MPAATWYISHEHVKEADSESCKNKGRQSAA